MILRLYILFIMTLIPNAMLSAFTPLHAYAQEKDYGALMQTAQDQIKSITAEYLYYDFTFEEGSFIPKTSKELAAWTDSMRLAADELVRTATLLCDSRPLAGLRKVIIRNRRLDYAPPKYRLISTSVYSNVREGNGVLEAQHIYWDDGKTCVEGGSGPWETLKDPLYISSLKIGTDTRQEFPQIMHAAFCLHLNLEPLTEVEQGNPIKAVRSRGSERVEMLVNQETNTCLEFAWVVNGKLIRKGIMRDFVTVAPALAPFPMERIEWRPDKVIFYKFKSVVLNPILSEETFQPGPGPNITFRNPEVTDLIQKKTYRWDTAHPWEKK